MHRKCSPCSYIGKVNSGGYGDRKILLYNYRNESYLACVNKTCASAFTKKIGFSFDPERMLIPFGYQVNTPGSRPVAPEPTFVN